MGSCRVVAIEFDTYYDVSLKNFTRSGHLGNEVPVEFAVDDAFDIIDASSKEILSHTRTKQQLTSLDIDFAIAGNGSTIMSWGEQSRNNHEEAHSRIVHMLLNRYCA